MVARGAIDDEQITMKVLVELGVEGIDRDQVNVETNNGVVKISGSVESPELRDTARNAAMRQLGVKDVELDLTVES